MANPYSINYTNAITLSLSQNVPQLYYLITLSIDAEGYFLKLMRQAQTDVELFNACDRFLLADMTKTVALAPYSRV